LQRSIISGHIRTTQPHRGQQIELVVCSSSLGWWDVVNTETLYAITAKKYILGDELMEAKEITLPIFHVVGLQIEANLKELESNLGRETYQSLVSRKDEIQNKKNGNVILIQIYPMKPNFNPQIDRFTQILCFEISEPSVVPPGMILHVVPENKYVTCTHKGLESELSRTYDYVYGKWIRETGNEPKGYDFEIWDERYKPESPDNEIDLFVALK
jgi:AraC family transcriptional regulator